MYKFKYIMVVKKGFDGTTREFTILEAKFRFKDEFSTSTNYYDIKSRTYPKGSLSDYLSEKEKLNQHYPSHPGLLFSKDFRKHVRITRLLFRLGFNLSASISENVPLEEMLDLDALNEFVLTGKK